MRKLWIRRRGVETVIGGLIVLVIFLTSLVAMMVLSQQYDLYQLTAATIQKNNTDRFSESLQAVIPGILIEPQVGPTSCGGGWCNTYNITLANLGIGLQIARIYINSTQSPGCTNICIIDPNPSTNPAPFKFQATQRYVNPGEFYHGVVFWLPWDPVSQKFTLSPQCTIGGTKVTYDCHTVTIVTTRGRTFSFQWPFPPAGGLSGAGGAGGTGIYIGPLVYTYQRALVAYTPPIPPQIPIGGTPNGYWIIPSGTVILYVKLQTDVGTKNDVYLTAQSVLELEVYTSPGSSPAAGSIIAPITPTLCQQIVAADPVGNSDVNCNTAYGYYPSGNTGSVSSVIPYQPCSPVGGYPDYNTANCVALGKGPRYMIPKPTQAQLNAHERGSPVIVAFVFSGQNAINSSWGTSHSSVLTFLGLTYVWDDGSGTGAYAYGVTLPFVALCIGSSSCPG